MPAANAEAMSLHLTAIGRKVAAGSHAALILDGAGYHLAAALTIPENVTLVRLPPYAPNSTDRKRLGISPPTRSALAERQSVMNSRPIPTSRRAATRLCPAARSARVAPCSASGVHSRVGTPLLTIVKSRSRTECSSSAILLGVAPSGSCGLRSPSASPEDPRKCAAKDDAISPADAAASAGQKNAAYGNTDTDPYPVRPCCLELGRFQPKNNPQTTWTTTDSTIRDMSQGVHHENDLNMSKCSPLFRR